MTPPATAPLSHVAFLTSLYYDPLFAGFFLYIDLFLFFYEDLFLFVLALIPSDSSELLKVQLLKSLYPKIFAAGGLILF